MAEFFSTWIIPFTFIPGVAALILSTSNRFFHVNSLIRSQIKEGGRQDILGRLLKRSSFFHSALTLMYTSIGCFSVSALLGNLHQNWYPGSEEIIIFSDILVLSGVFCVVTASIQLVRESFLSFTMIKEQVEQR